MVRKKAKKEPGDLTQASVKKEMAKPSMSKSARIAERNLDPTRIPEQPNVTMPGTIDKIILSPRPNQLEKAHIAVNGADHRYRHLRIDNAFIDENGDDVKLKMGARVEVTVTADPETSTAPINEVIQLTQREIAGLGFGRRKS